MNSVLMNAKAHFQQVMQREGLRCVDVAEWGENNQPAKIYFKPLSSLPIKIYSQLVALGRQQTVESFVDILILRAVDDSGNPLFKPLDKTEMLRHISPIVVCDLVKRMSESEENVGMALEIEAKADVFCCYALADRLHKTLDEISEMPLSEFMGWMAYLKKINQT